MPTSTPTSNDNAYYRRPLETQRNLGGDMSMMCFVRPQCPQKFDSPNKHQIKGLNVKALGEIFFPPPTWMTDSNYNYSNLRANSENDDQNWGSFSVNMSMYNQILIETEWDDKWFFMYGRVHPYALTWEIKPEIGNNLQPYTTPALIVRDQGYQP